MVIGTSRLAPTVRLNMYLSRAIFRQVGSRTRNGHNFPMCSISSWTQTQPHYKGIRKNESKLSAYNANSNFNSITIGEELNEVGELKENIVRRLPE